MAMLKNQASTTCHDHWCRKNGTMMIEELVNEEYKIGKPIILVDDDQERKEKESGVLNCGRQ